MLAGITPIVMTTHPIESEPPMDNETLNSLVFMAFGLGFFLLVMHVILKDAQRTEDRKDKRSRHLDKTMYRDRQEFGYDAVEQSLEAAHRRKPLLRKII